MWLFLIRFFREMHSRINYRRQNDSRRTDVEHATTSRHAPPAVARSCPDSCDASALRVTFDEIRIPADSFRGADRAILHERHASPFWMISIAGLRPLTAPRRTRLVRPKRTTKTRRACEQG